jgi:two-component system response regulator NreC
MDKIRVLIADDHALFREGIRMILEAQPDIEIVGEAEDGQQVIEEARRVRPDVVVMDIAMPVMDGLQATRVLREELPGVRILALTMHEHRGYVLPMLTLGASGYVLKRAASTELVEAIRRVYANEAYLYPPVAKALLEEYRKEASSHGGGSLTERELEVLQLVTEGMTSQEIADRLFISVRTVETHRKHIMEKLGLHTPADLVKYALRQGLIHL